MAHILVVEDEPAIAESVAYALKRDGYVAETAATLAAAEPLARTADLVVLDLMLPDGSGFDLISRLRRESITVPVIVLSSRDSEADRVAALETGADDYVTKPFSPREIVARVRAVLRRVSAPQPAEPKREKSDETQLSLDEATRRAWYGSTALELTRVEFDLLAVMLESRDRVYTRSQLIERVWGDGFALSDRTVDSHIKSLRKKVTEAGGSAGLIETVRGVGYRVNEQPTGEEPCDPT